MHGTAWHVVAPSPERRLLGGKQMTRQELESFIVEYGKDIYSFCNFLTRDRYEAEELYQEVFLRATTHQGRMNIQENPKGYLLSMALRIWKDRQRKLARRQRIAPLQTYVEGWELGTEEQEGMEQSGSFARSERQTPEAAVLQRELQARVRQAVAGLPEKYRTVVLLYYMEEMDISQIARILGVPEGTVKSRLFQARKQLKRKLECIYDE